MPQQEVTRPKSVSAVFHLKNVSKLYDTDAPYLALNRLNLDIRDGEILTRNLDSTFLLQFRGCWRGDV